MASNSRNQGKGNMKKNKPFDNKKKPSKKIAVDKQVKDPQAGMRLNKYISNAGICSRRDADIYITAGSVRVNGEVVTEMGHKVKLTDEVKFDGRKISPEKKEYVLLNKPSGFYVTGSLEKNNRTVMDLIANASNSKLDPVGKLETSTTGLLLFTNDGTMAKSLGSSKTRVRQIYHITLNKNLDQEDLEKISEGRVILEDGKVTVDDISYVDNRPKREVGLELQSTRIHIVQRTFKKLGYEIVKLDRVVFGGLTKKDLPRGNYRHLTRQEVINLGML
ncbi:pseudouridine synthase [Mesonia aestuariivivens]|uniref:rRNA pseudouridine synthase n=1 Tax=Mesonia aestuariivivens TaxID=2796128 RepID=A0ABS6VZG7_9FLAO|nr:pseudouridine synthase [Mesonia aestuariivivens]MBW2960984.1 rRNA pseudouridine synthase [Mesonia aestuariivivens]